MLCISIVIPQSYEFWLHVRRVYIIYPYCANARRTETTWKRDGGSCFSYFRSDFLAFCVACMPDGLWVCCTSAPAVCLSVGRLLVFYLLLNVGRLFTLRHGQRKASLFNIMLYVINSDLPACRPPFTPAEFPPVRLACPHVFRGGITPPPNQLNPKPIERTYARAHA